MKGKFRLKAALLILLFFIPLCVLGYLFFRVTDDASNRIERGVIERIIAAESPVFYDDGKTPIGVFFEKTHRSYIKYEDIPKTFVKAIVASEDRSFFRHCGFDIKAILRAFLANLGSGTVIQGGSTITQQTAKNIFKREKRSYKAKFKELIQAFLLERRYSKEEILEMYANQFFVTGYGKGLGIASQYFFAKDARELDLVEAAFIAGSLKGPNRYNPFIKTGEREKQRAMELAKERKDYVLSNMLRENFITRSEYLEAKSKEVPFKEGKITYRLKVVMDYIRRQLESDYFKEILLEQGVDNIATSGIGIFTSINKQIQDQALQSLRQWLPRLDVQLRGYGSIKDDMIPEIGAKGLPGKLTDGLPFFARITHIDQNSEAGSLVVAWNGGGGIIGYEGMKDMGEAWIKWKRGSWSRFQKADVPSFLKIFCVGELIPVRVVEESQRKPAKGLCLASVPQLEGGLIVLQKGMVSAMVGGFYDRFFNRSVDARRQLGSIFKPFVLSAALNLKWNSLDPLENITTFYDFENTDYIPRPDHRPESDKVSLAWAGVKSENLAAVWLLYHLTDNLTLGEFRKIVEITGFSRRENEDYSAYEKRLRDGFGILAGSETLREAAFEESKKELGSDIIFGDFGDADVTGEIIKKTNRLYYNLNLEDLNIEESEVAQLERYDFSRLIEKAFNIKDLLGKLEAVYSTKVLSETGRRTLINVASRLFFDQEHQGRIIYSENPKSITPSLLATLKPDDLLEKVAFLNTKDIWIEGVIPCRALELLASYTETGYKRLASKRPYELETLSKIRDFRTLVNISYVVYLAKELGIMTQLDPVLSLPLGPTSISIMEAALAYNSIMTGNAVAPLADGGVEMIPLITKITDRQGEVIWQYTPKQKKVLSDRVRFLMVDILRKVVKVGTGKKAEEAVRVMLNMEGKDIGVPVPSYGKTGTANRFTNSSYVGFIPGVNTESGEMDLNSGYVIAGYVGYDDNRPMKSDKFSIYGSSGALPLWIDTANAVVNTDKYKENFQPAELIFEDTGKGFYQGMIPVNVSPASGLPAPEEKRTDSTAEIIAEAQFKDERLILKRHFEPVTGGTN